MVKKYLRDLLARPGWRSTDLRMTIMVVAMWNDVNDGASKPAQYPQALKSRKEKHDYFYKECAEAFPGVRFIGLGPVDLNWWNTNACSIKCEDRCLKEFTMMWKSAVDYGTNWVFVNPEKYLKLQKYEP